MWCVLCTGCQVVRSRADAKRELLQVQQKAAKALTILRNSFQVNGVKKTLSVTYDHPHLTSALLALDCCPCFVPSMSMSRTVLRGDGAITTAAPR